MKRNLKTILLQRQNALASILIIASLAISGCTKDFEKYNTNPNALSNDQTLSIAPTAFGPIERAIYSNYQRTQNLSADAYSGYTMSKTNFGSGSSNLNYAMTDGWNQVGFDEPYKLIVSPISKMALAGIRTKTPDQWGVALLLEVEAMHRVTDRFGPIPYTKVGTSLTSIPYDDQQTVYNTFFKQIDTAVTNLRAFLANPANADPAAADPTYKYKNLIGANDGIYGGKYTQWLKFANSLRFRLAMRIVKAAPATAKLQGEIALSAPEGLLSTPLDDASIKPLSAGDYLWQLAEWGDTQMSAAIGTYLTGYNDPRAPVYFKPAAGGKFVGIRIGSDVSKVTGYNTLSLINETTFTQLAPQLIMTASEMWFLKAEASLRHWTGAGDAKTNYETGINTSMQQWGVSPGSYISDNTSTQVDYKDPFNSANDAVAISTITIKWNPAGTDEENLERIITQKWLAIFPNGQEAWADYRRTGYPKLFPVVQNKSAGTIITATQIRRLPYPSTEYNKNTAAVNAAVGILGPDNGGTRLWWDVNKPNF
jgi:hypothetical protein